MLEVLGLFFSVSFIGIVLVGLHLHKKIKLKDEYCKQSNVASCSKSLGLAARVLGTNKETLPSTETQLRDRKK